MLGKIESRASYRMNRFRVNTVQARFNHDTATSANVQNTHSLALFRRFALCRSHYTAGDVGTFGLFSLRAQIRFCCVFVSQGCASVYKRKAN